MPAGQGRPANARCRDSSRNRASPGADVPAVIRKEEHLDARCLDACCHKGLDQTRCLRRGRKDQTPAFRHGSSQAGRLPGHAQPRNGHDLGGYAWTHCRLRQSIESHCRRVENGSLGGCVEPHCPDRARASGGRGQGGHDCAACGFRGVGGRRGQAARSGFRGGQAGFGEGWCAVDCCGFFEGGRQSRGREVDCDEGGGQTGCG